MVTACPQPIGRIAVYAESADVAPASRQVWFPCNRYDCRVCGPGRRARVHKLIRAGVRVGLGAMPNHPARLITVTYPRRDDRSFDRAADMRAASEDWRRLVQRMRRAGVVLEYGRVVERTKAGRIHLHAITWGSYVPKCTDRGRRARGLQTGRGSGSPCYCAESRPCIQRAAWAEGFGWVEVRRIRSPKGASSYVAKYLSKQGADHRWPKYARRFSYSRRFAAGLTLGAIDADWREFLRARAAVAGVVMMPPPTYWRDGILSRRQWQRRPWAFGLPPPLPAWPAHYAAALPDPY